MIETVASLIHDVVCYVQEDFKLRWNIEDALCILGWRWDSVPLSHKRLLSYWVFHYMEADYGHPFCDLFPGGQEDLRRNAIIRSLDRPDYEVKLEIKKFCFASIVIGRWRNSVPLSHLSSWLQEPSWYQTDINGTEGLSKWQRRHCTCPARGKYPKQNKTAPDAGARAMMRSEHIRSPWWLI